MRNPFISILGRLSVGTKLLLIYLLDLTAVIYISSILINEKYIAINFARDELRGNAYIATARDGLIDVALVGAGGLKVVAEGVETAQEVDILRSADCDEFQGFFFARPMPAHELPAWLAARDADRKVLVQLAPRQPRSCRPD